MMLLPSPWIISSSRSVSFKKCSARDTSKARKQRFSDWRRKWEDIWEFLVFLFPFFSLLIKLSLSSAWPAAWGVHWGNGKGENQANQRLSALTALERAKVYPWEVECVKDQTARREFNIWMAQLVNYLSRSVSALTQISSTPWRAMQPL